MKNGIFLPISKLIRILKDCKDHAGDIGVEFLALGNPGDPIVFIAVMTPGKDKEPRVVIADAKGLECLENMKSTDQVKEEIAIHKRLSK